NYSIRSRSFATKFTWVTLLSWRDLGIPTTLNFVSLSTTQPRSHRLRRSRWTFGLCARRKRRGTDTCSVRPGVNIASRPHLKEMEGRLLSALPLGRFSFSLLRRGFSFLRLGLNLLGA